MKGRTRLLLPILFATLFYTSVASAYSSPDGDPNYIDNYDTNNDYQTAILGDVKEPVPEPKIVSPCTAAMTYNDYVANGYGMN